MPLNARLKRRDGAGSGGTWIVYGTNWPGLPSWGVESGEEMGSRARNSVVGTIGMQQGRKSGKLQSYGLRFATDRPTRNGPGLRACHGFAHRQGGDPSQLLPFPTSRDSSASSIDRRKLKLCMFALVPVNNPRSRGFAEPMLFASRYWNKPPAWRRLCWFL